MGGGGGTPEATITRPIDVGKFDMDLDLSEVDILVVVEDADLVSE